MARNRAVITNCRVFVLVLTFEPDLGNGIHPLIFCYSLKNVQGTEITGTNSMIERSFLDSVKPGQVKEITFTQRMTLQGGEYLVSLGVTGYRGDTFEVYHRLYDVINITCVSDKNTVGFYDMESSVVVTDATN